MVMVVHIYSMQPCLSSLSLNLGNILMKPRFFAQRNFPVKEPLGFWLCCGIVLCSEPIMCPGLSGICTYLLLQLRARLGAHSRLDF